MVRIAIDAHSIGDMSGGNETYYRNFLENLRNRDNLEYYILLNKGVDFSFINCKFTPVFFNNKSSVKRNFFELNKIIKKYKIDILHTQYFVPFFKRCKFVVTIHDISFEHFSDIFSKRQTFTQRVLIKRAAKKADEIITVSNFSKEDIMKTYKIPADKITVAYPAPADIYNDIGAIDETLVERFHISKDFILTVGNLQPRKNLVRLIKAYKKLVHDGVTNELVIVGKKDWNFSKIFNEANDDDMHDKIKFTGYIDKNDLKELYRQCKYFVYPSLFEGFGAPPVEAMACGTDVCVSSAASLPEAVQNHALFFDPYDIDDIAAKMKEMLEKEKTEVSKKANMSIANKYSWKKTADTIENIYERIGTRND